MTDWIRSGQVRFYPILEPLLIDIDAVEPAPWNYNNGDVERIAESIATNGMYGIVRVQEDTGHIFIGNHTWLACKELGSHQIPALSYPVDDETARRLAIADNEIARQAKPDPGQMLALVARLKETTVGLTGTGVTDRDFERLKRLNESPLNLGNQTASDDPIHWPTLSILIPPSLHKAFMEMTDDAKEGDLRDRLELLMRMGGWDG